MKIHSRLCSGQGLTNQVGAVLIHVLLLSILISSICLAYFQALANRTALTHSIQNRTLLMIDVLNVKSDIEAILLSQNFSSVPKGFNLYGYPFTVDGVEVQITDLSGLFPIYPQGNTNLQALLMSLGYSTARAKQAVDSLNDWQSPHSLNKNSRRGPIQHLSELEFVPGIGADIYQSLKPFVTLFPRPFFNPSLSPDTLIQLRYGKRVAEVVKKARLGRGFTTEDFIRLTGENMDEFTSFSFGPGFRVRLSASRQGVTYGETFEGIYKATESSPVQYWSKLPFDSEFF